MENMLKNKVIIWGADDYNTLALIRQIGQGTNNLFYLINGPARYAAFSKYCTQYHTVENANEGLKYLIDHFNNEPVKPILLTSSDGVVTLMDKNKEKLIDKYFVPGTELQGDLEKYIDKYNMTILAKEIGIVVPDSKFVMWDTDVEDIECPCFIKPSHQKPGHYNEFKFKYCETLDDLKNTLKYVRHDSVFIVQQYIKKEKDLLVYGCRTPQGETIIAGGLITERFAVGNGSSYGYVDGKVHPSIDVEKIKQFLDVIGYVGLFSFEYGLCNNKAYFFETNLRNDGTSHFFFMAGANIPLTYALSCANEDLNKVSHKVTKPCYYMDEIFDISNVILGNVSKKEWKKQYAGVAAFKFIYENDMQPYELAKKNRFVHIIRDIVIRKYRLYLMIVLDKIGLRK